MTRSIFITFLICLTCSVCFAADPNVVAVGDSITLGAGLSQNLDYPSRLSQWMFGKGDFTSVTNSGVSGDTAMDIGDRLGDDLYAYYDSGSTRNICILMIGTNDLHLHGRTPAQVDADIDDLVQDIQAEGWEVVLCTVTYRSDSGSTLSKIQDLNTLIRANADADMIFDAYQSMINKDGSGLATSFLQSGGLHLTWGGCEMLGKKLEMLISGRMPTADDITDLIRIYQ